MNDEDVYQLLSVLNRIAIALENIGEGVHLAANQGTVTLQNNEFIAVTKPMRSDAP
jgi:hypothetical protein